MKNPLTILSLLAIPALILISCAQNNPIAPTTKVPEQGKISFAMSVPDDIAYGHVIIAKGDQELVKEVTIANNTGSVTFDDLQVGKWYILVQLFDGDAVMIYDGQGEAMVTKDQTTTVTIRVTETGGTGSLEITVEVPGGVTPTPTPSATAIVIDDFESYIVGQPIAGQGDWKPSSNCGPRVVFGNLSGQSLRSGSCSPAQSAHRDYNFQFNDNMSNSYLQMSAKINYGSGNNCGAKLRITDTANKWAEFGLGFNKTLRKCSLSLTSNNSDHRIQGLNTDTWYDIRLEIDWTKSTTNSMGRGSIKYKASSDSTWIAEPSLQNIELEVESDKIVKLRCRMDGIRERLGEIDNIIVYYGR